MSSDADVQAKVDLLGKVFLGRLPVRFEKMHEVLALCQQDVSNTGHWQELRRLIHSLGGAAGTFGFPELGQEARAMEMVLDQRLAEGGWQEADVVLFGTALAKLQRPR
jgi:HPt (histidine-containing phosphotransfer) domain-containing protein